MVFAPGFIEGFQPPPPPLAPGVSHGFAPTPPALYRYHSKLEGMKASVMHHQVTAVGGGGAEYFVYSQRWDEEVLKARLTVTRDFAHEGEEVMKYEIDKAMEAQYGVQGACLLNPRLDPAWIEDRRRTLQSEVTGLRQTIAWMKEHQKDVDAKDKRNWDNLKEKNRLLHQEIKELNQSMGRLRKALFGEIAAKRRHVREGQKDIRRWVSGRRGRRVSFED